MRQFSSRVQKLELENEKIKKELNRLREENKQINQLKEENKVLTEKLNKIKKDIES
jgi:cell shape-determining protein MreC